MDVIPRALLIWLIPQIWQRSSAITLHWWAFTHVLWISCNANQVLTVASSWTQGQWFVTNRTGFLTLYIISLFLRSERGKYLLLSLTATSAPQRGCHLPALRPRCQLTQSCEAIMLSELQKEKSTKNNTLSRLLWIICFRGWSSSSCCEIHERTGLCRRVLSVKVSQSPFLTSSVLKATSKIKIYQPWLCGSDYLN